MSVTLSDDDVVRCFWLVWSLISSTVISSQFSTSTLKRLSLPRWLTSMQEVFTDYRLINAGLSTFMCGKLVHPGMIVERKTGRIVTVTNYFI